jgi:ketosteroid isomerase-like protein
VRELLGLWNEHRIAELTVHFHQDIEIDARDMPQPDICGVYRGYERLGKWVTDWLAAWEHQEVEPLWLESRGDLVVTWMRSRLIGKGSGVSLESDAGWGFWFSDGKISRMRVYVDEQKARDEIGVEVARE